MPIRFAALPGAALLLAAPALAVAPDPVALVAAREADTTRVARQIWEWAEVGYKEDRSSALLASELSRAGFKVTKGVAGIPTAFTAEWGTGGPLIAVLGEYDALPGISQAAVPARDPIAGKPAAHACGHNLFGAASMTAAIAVKEWLEKTGTPGRVRFYGTPAEEGGSGKVYLVRDGLFDDVDFTINWHPGDENSAAAETSLANRSAKFRFHGRSAHAAGAPDQGRSALDGVEAMNMMVNLMREHTTMDSRIHYVITEGGKAPNVIPDFAEVFYYVRHSRTDEVEAMWSRVEAAAKGAAMGTGTKVEWEVIHGNNPLLVNETLQAMMDAKLRALGGIAYSAEERAFAERIAPTLAKARPIESAQMVAPYARTLGYGSTDVGDVSWATPTVGFNTATWVPGTPSHSWQSAAASGMSIGFKGAQLAAKAMALAAVELYTDPALRAAAKAEFDAARGRNYTYRSLLGDRKPPLDYRD
ncbi:amidohydrolase [Tsuneonella sp. YG55]|uniref:Amidohydrolase n=1 Tax=Tsuneonella litorea TaxID=2976475 RepID=A0A9X2VYJ0_9SPHN|nr:amidohydrolase [Tsuneonella litorea]MCT2557667.1 amidohydrolase [Tsuneonella litorea]